MLTCASPVLIMTVPCRRIARLRFAARSDAQAMQSIAIATPFFAAASHRRSLPKPRLAIRRPCAAKPFFAAAPRPASHSFALAALLMLSYPSPSLLNAKLIFPLPARCPAFPVFSRPVLCSPVLCPRHATPCHAFAPLCTADAQQCHASALRCDALPLLSAAMQCHAPALLFMTHAPQINPAPFRCHSILCIPFAWARPCNARASPITAFAVPIIAVTMLCVASPARCWAIHCRHRAFPR